MEDLESTGSKVVKNGPTAHKLYAGGKKEDSQR